MLVVEIDYTSGLIRWISWSHFSHKKHCSRQRKYHSLPVVRHHMNIMPIANPKVERNPWMHKSGFLLLTYKISNLLELGKVVHSWTHMWDYSSSIWSEFYYLTIAKSMYFHSFTHTRVFIPSMSKLLLNENFSLLLLNIAVNFKCYRVLRSVLDWHVDPIHKNVNQCTFLN